MAQLSLSARLARKIPWSQERSAPSRRCCCTERAFLRENCHDQDSRQCPGKDALTPDRVGSRRACDTLFSGVIARARYARFKSSPVGVSKRNSPGQCELVGRLRRAPCSVLPARPPRRIRPCASKGPSASLLTPRLMTTWSGKGHKLTSLRCLFPPRTDHRLGRCF